MRTLQLTYTTKRGVGVVRAFSSADECERVLKSLRVPAVLHYANGEQAGGVYESDGTDFPVQWIWWLDRQAFDAVMP